jgi:hypothetical protein
VIEDMVKVVARPDDDSGVAECAESGERLFLRRAKPAGGLLELDPDHVAVWKQQSPIWPPNVYRLYLHQQATALRSSAPARSL